MWNKLVESVLGTPRQRRDRKITALYRSRKSMKHIGREVGLSSERVRQILKMQDWDEEIAQELKLTIAALLGLVALIVIGCLLTFV